MRGRGLFLAALVAAAASLAAVGDARACSCAPLAPREALRQADAAIVGELLRVLPRGSRLADFRFEVRRVYKSVRPVGRIVSVRSSLQTAACGLPQRTGRRYGLFLSRSGGRWRGGLCGVVAPRRLRAVASRTERGSRGFAGFESYCAS